MDAWEAVGKDALPEDVEGVWQSIQAESVEWQKRAVSLEAWRIHPKSRIAGDDEAARPVNVSSAAMGLICTAIDHLHALCALVMEFNTLHVCDATLARGSLESSNVATWILAPHKRGNRIERGLRWYARDMSDKYSAYRDAGIEFDPSAEDAERKVLRGVAERNDLDVGRALTPFYARTAIREAETSMSEFARSRRPAVQWQLASGFAHGRDWALQAASKKQPMGMNEKGGVVLYHTREYEDLLPMALAAAISIAHALTLWERISAHPVPPSVVRDRKPWPHGPEQLGLLEHPW